jgi:large subunit ribosomal protein L25
MITDTVLQAIPRNDRGKNAARRLRAEGRIPASVYGIGLDSIPVSVNARELGVILRSESGTHSIFTLAIDGRDSSPVKIHDYTIDPVTSRLTHMDLMRISMTVKTRVSVPLEFTGESAAIKAEGGMLEMHLHEIEVECLPRDIPANITVDVSGLNIGDQLYVSQINAGDDVTIVSDSDLLVAAISSGRIHAEQVTTEETPEPQV